MYEPEFKNYLISHGITLEYLSAVSYWIRWCNQQGVDICLPTYSNIMDFVSQNVQADVSNGTINNRLKALRKYYVFMVETGRVPPGIIDEVNKFVNLKTDIKVKNVLDKEEFARLVGHLMSASRVHRPEKIRAIMFFMYYTGPRISEVVNLKRQDINLEKNQVIFRVPMKNKTERYGYFPGGDKLGITHYLRRYFTIEPEVFNAFNMSEYQIRRLISLSNKFLPPGRKIHPHTLRHCFGNMLAEGNVNVRVAQKLLGHKNINSTMIYYDPDQKTVEKIYRENIAPVGVIKPEKTNERVT